MDASFVFPFMEHLFTQFGVKLLAGFYNARELVNQG